MKLTRQEETKLLKKITNLLDDEKYKSVDVLGVFQEFLENHDPTILQWIKEMFTHAKKKEWFETYWAIDIHGTVSAPDFRKDSPIITYYPYAKETLQLMSEREDIKLIMFTSSYPDEIKVYQKTFEKDDIHFDFINENPDVSDAKGSFGYYYDKPYFNVLLEDKGGFKPEVVWKYLYDYFKNTKYRPNSKWSMKYKEEYHK